MIHTAKLLKKKEKNKRSKQRHAATTTSSTALGTHELEERMKRRFWVPLLFAFVIASRVQLLRLRSRSALLDRTRPQRLWNSFPKIQILGITEIKFY
jgi:hypothetical protein